MHRDEDPDCRRPPNDCAHQVRCIGLAAQVRVDDETRRSRRHHRLDQVLASRDVEGPVALLAREDRDEACGEDRLGIGDEDLIGSGGGADAQRPPQRDQALP